jgi:hypothetical protein
MRRANDRRVQTAADTWRVDQHEIRLSPSFLDGCLDRSLCGRHGDIDAERQVSLVIAQLPPADQVLPVIRVNQQNPLAAQGVFARQQRHKRCLARTALVAHGCIDSGHCDIPKPRLQLNI